MLFDEVLLTQMRDMFLNNYSTKCIFCCKMHLHVFCVQFHCGAGIQVYSSHMQCMAATNYFCEFFHRKRLYSSDLQQEKFLVA